MRRSAPQTRTTTSLPTRCYCSLSHFLEETWQYADVSEFFLYLSLAQLSWRSQLYTLQCLILEAMSRPKKRTDSNCTMRKVELVGTMMDEELSFMR